MQSTLFIGKLLDPDVVRSCADLLRVGNLHCPSCVATIEDLLTSEPLHIPLESISISLVTGVVSVKSNPDSPTSTRLLFKTLQDAGFDVSSIDGVTPTGVTKDCTRSSWHTSKRTRERRQREAEAEELLRAEAHRATCKACQAGDNDKGKAKECVLTLETAGGMATTEIAITGMTCASCVGAAERILSPASDGRILSSKVTLLPARAIIKHRGVSEAELLELLEDGGYGGTVVKTTAADEESWTETKLVIDGMTCSSCVGSLKSILEALPGVRSLQVTLLPAFAVVVHDSHHLSTEMLVEAVEDGGYGAELVSSSMLQPKKSLKEEEVREVKLRIDGFYCEKCPAAINDLLGSLVQSSSIRSFTPLSFSLPVTTIVYLPDPSERSTLRHFRTLITAIGPFSLTPLHSAATLTVLARRAQARERRAMAIRVLITFIFAIPTFFIAIVAMSLVSSSHPLRIYFDTQVWGSASRGTVALFALATPIQFGVGSMFYLRAWKSLRGVWTRRGWRDKLLRWGSMDTLVALGTTVSWTASVAFMALDVQAGGGNMTGDMGYFDSSVFLLLFILAGRWLEGVSRQKTGDAVEALGKTKASEGLLWLGKSPDAEEEKEKVSAASEESLPPPSPSGLTQSVEVDFLERGDTLLVPSGASVALDAILLPTSSSSNFDESSLTGESHPVLRSPGDRIFAGSTNLGPSAVLARIASGPGQTMMDGIVEAVREAMSRKASIERFADVVTGYFVPAIVSIAVLTFTVWLARGYAGNLPSYWIEGAVERRGGWTLFAIQFTVAVLVAACPCGIGLAAPTAQMVGLGLAAKLGIVPYGGGEAFQNATKIDVVVFDKTGTLTLGEFKVVNAMLYTLPSDLSSSIDSTILWRLLDAVESTSAHPISIGIQSYCRDQTQGSSPLNIECLKSEEVAGRGLIATVTVAGQLLRTLVGNEALMAEHDVRLDPVRETIREWSSAGNSLILVAFAALSSPKVDEEDDALPHYNLAALVGVQDPPRPEAAAVISELKSLGIVSYMCTGDNRETALAIAAQVGVEERHVFAGVLPVEKQLAIEKLQRGTTLNSRRRLRSQRRRCLFSRSDSPPRAKVMFVGDGINDIVALTQADVGVSMGTGAAVALSSSDFCLLSSNLMSLLTLLALAKSTYRKILTNFFWATLFNTVLIPVAAGAFYDLGRTRLPPVWAALAMALSSVSVVTNSLSMRWTFRVPRAVRQSRLVQQ